MKPSLRALLKNVIDYAGMFPPARLPVRESIRNYITYRWSEKAWIIGRFVCAAKEFESLKTLRLLANIDALREFAPEIAQAIGTPDANATPPDPSVPISIAAAPMETLAATRKNLQAVFATAEDFARDDEARNITFSLEWKMPADVVELADGIPRAFDCLPNDCVVPLDSAFCEVPLEAAERHASAVASFEHRTNVKLGLKFRTGGLEAAAFPSSQALAAAISACLRHGVAWKCTAGLHHPLPRYDASVSARMHGFINVLAASSLGFANQLDETTLQAILDEESAQAFAFSGKGLAWHEHSATLPQIEQARELAMQSLGSCSCEEPWEDLKALGWLP